MGMCTWRHLSRFKTNIGLCCVRFNLSFEGTGASKKLAKQACARMALTKLYGMTFTPLGGILSQPGASCDAGDKVMLVPGRDKRVFFTYSVYICLYSGT